MKLLIDISKDRYDEIMSMYWKSCRLIFDEKIRAIHDGKALEQEPCADMVSRDAMWEVLQRLYGTEGELVEELMSLPPVLPMPKIGRWIEHFDESGKWYECDKCHTDWGGSVNYCPNCGAKMSEIPTVAEGSEE